MRGFFFAVSLLFVSVGTMLGFYPRQSKAAVRGFFYKVDLRLLSLVPAVLGVLMLVGAFTVREVFGLAFVLGLLALAKAVYVAFGSADRLRRLRDWWFDQSGDIVLRVTGLVMFLLGAAMLSRLV